MNENQEHTGRRWQIPPLVARELLIYSRLSWTYWLRVLSALGAVSVFAAMAATGRNRIGEAHGLALFAGSTAILFLIASLNGLRSTSHCIASERRQGTFLGGLCAVGVTGIWLGLKQRSLSRASLSGCFYFLLLPASLYILRPMSPVSITVVFEPTEFAIAILMHRKLGRLVQGGDTVQRLLRRAEW